MNQPTIVVACDSCGETGVLPGIRNDIGIVCARCSGNGFYERAYTPFTGLKKRGGIKRVRRSGQGVLNDASEVGITYAEFLKGKRP